MKHDLLDTELLRLLQQKMEWEVRCTKCAQTENRASFTPIQTDVEKSFWKSQDVQTAHFLKQAWHLVEKEAERIRTEPSPVIAYQGEMGAYSEAAAIHVSAAGKILSAERFEDVFEGIDSGLYDFGIVPVENSIGGIVDAVNHLLWQYAPKIVGAVVQPIHHSLLAKPGTPFSEIEKVVSHPQALRQCKQFIETNKYQPIPVSNTATAARMVSEEQDLHVGAIASQNAASAYGLEILKTHVEDTISNRTRFVIISKSQTDLFLSLLQEGENKCSVAFGLSNEPGSLFEVLKKAYAEEISLTRLDSVSLEPEKYFFFVDFIWEATSSRIHHFLDWLESNTLSYRFLGSYKEVLL